MKKSNVIIFVVVILVIIAIFGYAIWDANNSLNEMGENTENYDGNILKDSSLSISCTVKRRSPEPGRRPVWQQASSSPHPAG